MPCICQEEFAGINSAPYHQSCRRLHTGPEVLQILHVQYL